MIRFVLRASYGNDSVALIQWAYEQNLTGVTVLYSDTGWARDTWLARVTTLEMWAHSLGFQTARTESIGLEELVRRKKMWPQRLMQFCTKELKILPAIAWFEKHDPEKRAIVLTGVRREESEKRKNAPAFIINSLNDGGRCCMSPLADFTEEERNGLLLRAGVEPLPHRSMECFPCINAGKEDIKLLEEKDIAKIETIETSLGFSSKGKPRTMFRPNKHMGATGIREMVKWAHTHRGLYEPPEEERDRCNSGWCGG